MEQVDQTVEFLNEVIVELRASGRFKDADDIAVYLTSAGGKAEYWPPNPFTERGSGSKEFGKRPSDDVAVWDKPYKLGAFRYVVIVSADEAAEKVSLSAYEYGSDRVLGHWLL